jgi:hypothetical protein
VPATAGKLTSKYWLGLERAVVNFAAPRSGWCIEICPAAELFDSFLQLPKIEVEGTLEAQMTTLEADEGAGVGVGIGVGVGVGMGVGVGVGIGVDDGAGPPPAWLRITTSFFIAPGDVDKYPLGERTI